MGFLSRLLLAACAFGIAVIVAEAQGLPRRTPNEPELLKEVRPDYTPDGRAAGIEGRVVLSAEVLDDGTVGDVKIVRPLDENKYGLDQEAVKAMKQWRFKPAMKDGKPVSVLIHVDMGFSLKEGRSESEKLETAWGQMRRFVGTIMAIGGMLIAPPLWDEMAAGGLRPRIVFAGALASIAAGLVISFRTGRGDFRS